ncbi:hypothetical protein [Pseudomonas syringae]|uniref:Uncharacterized protein n=1 Tax=Pseudomonas syringae pv. syringae TaxID=321 RepID=A0AAE5VT16_PSESY|nr:hypothetical protein [Pseudomonas syringae]ALU62894.1 hypothetical protein ACA40_24715 [Pseudomonas syringae pv. lapsa]MBS7422467.1 hypothetical protein [Pseudomonas syringae]MBS7434221.1 hypothetical protein [Pseudomonas syringae]MDF5834637.1 hypothetical protein [Pseudomonas syringae]PHN51071.1 hypothetical protein AO254_14600 [Pseudomonas syringae]
MDVKALRAAATTLRDKLEFYKRRDPDALILLLSLEGLLSRAEQGQITQMVEPREIPGYKLFTETRLQLYKDLEAAYTDFYIELIEARETEAYKILAAKMAKD